MKRHSLTVLAAAVALGAMFAASALRAATTLRATIHHSITANYVGGADIGSPTFTVDQNRQADTVLTTGTGTNQADTLYAATRSLAGSANETLDLYGGLTDAFGNTINCAKVKAMRVKAAAANAGNIVVGAAGSNPFLGPLGGTAPTVTIPADGVFLATAPGAGWAITNSSNDSLKVANSAGSTASYDIELLCTSS